MSAHSRSIDEQIRKAIQEGAFDNMPGKGKPLDLDINPYEEADWGMAFRMLRSSGYTLPWIETRREIVHELEEARCALARSWQWRSEHQGQKLEPAVIEREWQSALTIFETKIEDLNRRIFNYNLEIPSNQFSRLTINLEREFSIITDQSN